MRLAGVLGVLALLVLAWAVPWGWRAIGVAVAWSVALCLWPERPKRPGP